MPELQRLDAGHAPAVLAFELANRAYFAASVSDRGDEFGAIARAVEEVRDTIRAQMTERMRRDDEYCGSHCVAVRAMT